MWNQRSDTMTADLGLPCNKRALSEHTNTQMTVSLKDSSKIQFETNHANIFIGPYCQFVWTRCPRDQALFWHITMQLGVTSGHWFLIYATVEVEKEELRIKMNCSDATTRPYNFDWMSGGCCSPSLGDSYGRIQKYLLTSVSVVLSQVQTVRQNIPAVINGKSDD